MCVYVCVCVRARVCVCVCVCVKKDQCLDDILLCQHDFFVCFITVVAKCMATVLAPVITFIFFMIKLPFRSATYVMSHYFKMID